MEPESQQRAVEGYNAESQGALTAVVFAQNLKNLVFFGLLAYGVGFLVTGGGVFALVGGWLVVVLLAILALEPAAAAVLTLLSLFGPLPGKGWMVLQLTISGASALTYAWLSAYVWSRLYGVDLWSGALGWS